jgi:hypothetical protein
MPFGFPLELAYTFAGIPTIIHNEVGFADPDELQKRRRIWTLALL